MTIQERITFTFEEIVTLLVKDLQLIKLDEFTFRGTEESRAPLTLVAKRDISWDEIHRIIHTELKKVGKNPTDFTIKISGSSFLCIGKETSSTTEEEKPSASDIFLNTSLKELTSDEGEITKIGPSVRLYNALKASCTGVYESITLKEFLCIPHKPRNFGKKSMLEFTTYLSEKEIHIKEFRAVNWFPNLFPNY